MEIAMRLNGLLRNNNGRMRLALPNEGSQRLVGLDALRGIAALVVTFGHAATLTHTSLLTARTYLAVDLFFMLSGYVMAHSYEAKLAQGMRERDFIAARIRRLWPTMAVGAMVGLMSFWALGWWTMASPFAAAALFLQCLLFIPSLSGKGASFPLNFPAWSIFFEIFANVLHSLVLRRLNKVQLSLLAALCMIALLIFQQTPNPGGSTEDFYLGFPRAISSYAFGIVLQRLLRDRAIVPAWPGLAGLLAYLTLTHFFPTGLLIDWVFMAVVAPLCIITGLGNLPFQRTFSFLGALSFPLYAVHGPILMLMILWGYGLFASMAMSLVTAFAVMGLLRLFSARSRTNSPERSLLA